MKPETEKRMKEHLSQEDPEAQCLPTGVPRLSPYPMKYLQIPKLFVILFEGNIHSYRQIFLDRTEHPKDLNPSWYGDSIGHWEGDTLVVDTIGFNDRSWFDFAGHPHTEQLHTIERFRRPDLGHIDYEVTIDDPGAYTKPFTLYGLFLLMRGEIMEYICNENNRDVRQPDRLRASYTRRRGRYQQSSGHPWRPDHTLRPEGSALSGLLYRKLLSSCTPERVEAMQST